MTSRRTKQYRAKQGAVASCAPWKPPGFPPDPVLQETFWRGPGGFLLSLSGFSGPGLIFFLIFPSRRSLPTEITEHLLHELSSSADRP
ncbi:hypothetical protein Rmet_0914 [Cupriavidus metallidurans CH34]|uniref:Uncharacterized protein n=1 Tax=Cupriavidus metallidurans (strain ATCC 43123 / DSM 2839 / NBRC 102507 / CH34) TaxID=266264 RepID=Q1LPX6_CUPMC|nr:hypothetical protein Rmet_0914 [Cupriavidus metallidurans CH34]